MFTFIEGLPHALQCAKHFMYLFKHCCKVGIIFSLFMMRKLKPGKAERLVRSHATCEEGNGGLNGGRLTEGVMCSWP